MKKTQKVKLDGVCKIKSINTPKYIEELAKDAYSVFDCEDGVDYIGRLMIAKDFESTKNLPPQLTSKFQNFFTKSAYTSGVLLDFVPCHVEFELKDNFTMIHDVLAEVTLKDGIVTSIKNVDPANRQFQINDQGFIDLKLKQMQERYDRKQAENVKKA